MAQAIAFFADCYHQVSPVRSGYRLVLTYNVLVSQGQVAQSSRGNPLFAHTLARFFSEFEGRKRARGNTQEKPYLVFLLDHQYTQRSLSWNSLKGRDRQYLAEFMAVESDLELQMSLVLVDVKQTWNAESDDYEFDMETDDDAYRSSRRIKSLHPDDLIEEEFDLVYWLHREGTGSEDMDFHISSNCLFSLQETAKLKPYDSQFEGWMGNYGNTLDRWYHRAAIIVWQKKNNGFFQLKTNPKACLRQWIRDIQQGQSSVRAEIEKALPELQQMATRISAIADFVELAVVLSDPKISRELLQPIAAQLLNESNYSLLLMLASKYGDEWIGILLGLNAKSVKDESWSMKSAFQDGMTLLPRLYADRPKLGRRIFEKAWAVLLETWDDRISCGKAYIQKNEKETLKELGELLSVMRSVQDWDQDFSAGIAQEISQRHLLFDSVKTGSWLLGKKTDPRRKSQRTVTERLLISELKQRLESESAQQRRAGDWSIPDAPRCACPECKILTAFLRDSAAHQLVLPLRKDRRYHLHQEIDSMLIPVSHETSRVGSPYKLVIRKSAKAFEKDELRRTKARGLLEKIDLAIRE